MSTTDARPYVGRALPRLEDAALLRGEGRFMDDIDPVPHTRHAMIVRSPFAHARIGEIDTSAALAVPGVIGVNVSGLASARGVIAGADVKAAVAEQVRAA